MSRTIEELKRKAEQGSQQAQGEALEADLEEMLRDQNSAVQLNDAMAHSRLQPLSF